MNKKAVIENLIVAMLAQGISLLLSFLTSFIVPKMLDVEMFSFWQLFVFYITYVGFFHLGINDGVYLKYGGKYLEEMDKELVSGQFKCLLAIQLFIIAMLGSIVFVANIDLNRKFVLLFVLVYMLVFNLSNYLSYIFQAANLTKWYSYSVILDKFFFIVSIVLLLVAQINVFQTYICFYLCGKIVSLVYCMVKGRRIIFYKTTNWERVVEELKDSIRVGIKLTLSSMSGMLILGVGRFMIDAHWGIIVFGKISFALSLTTFVLAFIQQVSMVFFPVLRRVDEEHQMHAYQIMRQFCFFVMPFVYFIMIPGKIIISVWIPQYADSIYYLGVMLPICIFDAKMNMIFNTFFKVLRKEKRLLGINVAVMVVSCLLGFVGTYLLNSYWFVVVGMVFVVALRSFWSEVEINHIFGICSVDKSIYEICFAMVYMYISYMKLSPALVVAILAVLYIIEVTRYRTDFYEFLREVHGLMKKS